MAQQTRATVAAGSGPITLIDNVNGYTLNAAGELIRFQALLIDAAGKVIFAGARDVARKQGAGATRIDGRARTVLPGLIDAHGHVMGQGVALSALDLRGTATLQDAQRVISEYSRKHPDAAWIRGRGWNQEVWKLGRFPTAAELDAVVKDRPVWLRRVDGHAGWANTLALQRAAITRDTPDPPGGRIERDAKGDATGVLIDAAMGLIERQMPPLSEAENRAALDAVLTHLRSVGLTSVHDMGVNVETDALYREYSQQGLLTTRVYGAIAGAGPVFDTLTRTGPPKTESSDRYALRAVKLFSDGALGSRGAAMLAPYSDAPASHGLLFKSDALMRADLERVIKAGYQVAAHAIGDAANRQLLNAFAALSDQYPIKDKRHRIEHAQVIAPDDIARFAALGIIPSMQPIHATSDKNMAEARVGAERIKGAYAWRSLLKSGARIACGSDFPVEPANPFLGLHAAVTRQDDKDQPQGGWYANEAMTLKEALRCFTLDAAWAAHQEDVLGSLEPGKWADFIVVDRDIFRIAPR
ncbi:MAG: amidohydrolase, partial [Burkholderiales bacterium]|nr:amidohydrolase [Burkholderiales bacterium]